MNVSIDMSNIQKQGYLMKESKFLKQWRQYQQIFTRRYFALTPQHLISFENEKMQKMTEIIVLKDCTTIKSADDEIQKQCSIRLDFNKQSFFLMAQNNQEKESWIGAIGKLMVQQNMKKHKNSSDDEDMSQ